MTRKTNRRKRLKSTRQARFKRFLEDVSAHTPFVHLVVLLVVMWILFSGALYLAERNMGGASIRSYGEALYWGVAAFSTAGIADTPVTAAGQFVGALWIVLGSMLFFGTIVATATSYFMRPMQRPHKKIIDTIEYNLEQMDDLTLDELNLLKETVDTLIVHVEHLKAKQSRDH
ncbi:two pore domain potassium channel family protein [Pseudomonadota bacterium]